MDYREFIKRKSQQSENAGFTPIFMPDFLYPFQQNRVEWATVKGRSALFEDCGLGKTVQFLCWA
jgi:hypothetical protein